MPHIVQCPGATQETNMKPMNFPGRKLARRIRALDRMHPKKIRTSEHAVLVLRTNVTMDQARSIRTKKNRSATASFR